MKKARCKYGHKVAHKQNSIIRLVNSIKNINWDKVGVLSTVAALIIYTTYIKVVG